MHAKEYRDYINHVHANSKLKAIIIIPLNLDCSIIFLITRSQNKTTLASVCMIFEKE